MSFQPSRFSYGDTSPYTTATVRTDLMAPVTFDDEPTPATQAGYSESATAHVIALGLSALVITPFVIGLVKPEWAWSKRIGVGLIAGAGVSSAVQIGNAFSGKTE